MKTKKILIIFIVFLLLVNGCGNLKSSEKVPIWSVMPSEGIDDSVPYFWRENLAQWLNLSYYDDNNIAYFADIPSSSLPKSSIFSTYGAVYSLYLLNAEIRDSASIVNWILSLQTKEGYFKDTDEYAPELYQTYWALATIAILDSKNEANKYDFTVKSLPNVSKGLVMGFLQKNLTEMFSSANQSTEDDLNTTFIVIKILKLLNINYYDAKNVFNFTEIQSNINDLMDNFDFLKEPDVSNFAKYGHIMQALYILSYIDSQNSLLSANSPVYFWLRALNRNFGQLGAGIDSLMFLNTFIETVHVLYQSEMYSFSLESYVDKNRQFIENMLQNISNIYEASLALNVYTKVLRLDNNLYTDVTGKIYDHLVYITPNQSSFVYFTEVKGDIISSFFAFNLAKFLGIEDKFNKDTLSNYALSIIKKDIELNNLYSSALEKYFAKKLLETVDKPLNSEMQELLRKKFDSILTSSYESPSNLGKDKLFALPYIIMSYGNIPDTLKGTKIEKIREDILQVLKKDASNLDTEKNSYIYNDISNLSISLATVDAYLYNDLNKDGNIILPILHKIVDIQKMGLYIRYPISIQTVYKIVKMETLLDPSLETSMKNHPSPNPFSSIIKFLDFGISDFYSPEDKPINDYASFVSTYCGLLLIEE